MKLLHGKIGVKFDENHNFVHKIGDVELIIPKVWMDAENSAEKYSENINYLETKPQICTVVHESTEAPYRIGDRLFMHYMAYEVAEKIEDYWMVDSEFVIFKIGETWEMANDTYLGEAVWNESIRPSGIIIESKKDNLKVRLTHLPKDPKFKKGEVVVSIDKNNYPVKFGGKDYVKIKTDEIVATVI